jgi:hypothetical protein
MSISCPRGRNNPPSRTSTRNSPARKAERAAGAEDEEAPEDAAIAAAAVLIAVRGGLTGLARRADRVAVDLAAHRKARGSVPAEAAPDAEAISVVDADRGAGRAEVWGPADL